MQAQYDGGNILDKNMASAKTEVDLDDPTCTPITSWSSRTSSRESAAARIF